MVPSSPHSKHTTFPLYPTCIQRTQSPGCRIRCSDVRTGPSFMPRKGVLSVAFPEVIWIKTAACNVCTAIGRAAVRSAEHAQRREDLGAAGGLARAWWEHRVVQPLGKTVGRVPERQNTGLSSNSAIVVFLGVYPGELKVCLHKHLPTNVYGSAVRNRHNLEATKTSFSG